MLEKRSSLVEIALEVAISKSIVESPDAKLQSAHSGCENHGKAVNIMSDLLKITLLRLPLALLHRLRGWRRL